MTVGDLKREIVRIQGEVHMKFNEIRLMKNSREVKDHTLLKDAGIVDNDTLSMKKKCFPPWNILVAEYSGRTHTVTINFYMRIQRYGEYYLRLLLFFSSNSLKYRRRP